MVEYLSGERIQGSSTADIPTVSTLNATNGTTNWSTDTAKLTKSGNTITFSATGASNDEEIYYDLTSTSDDKWTLRFKADFTSIGAGASATHQQLQFGIYDSASPSGGNGSGDAIMFYLSSAGNVSNAVNGVNGGTSGITSTNNTPIASSGSAVTYYIELQRTSSSAIQAKVFDDEYETQVGSTLSKTGLSGITGLRYLMVRLWSEGGAGNGAVGSVTDMKFYNNTTSTTTDEKDDITNVPVNTRYEETDTRKIYRRVPASSPDPDFNFSSATGWGFTAVGSGESGSVTPSSKLQISNNNLNFVATDNAVNGARLAYYDLTSLDDDEWTVKFKLDLTDVSTITSGADQNAMMFHIGDDVTSGFRENLWEIGMSVTTTTTTKKITTDYLSNTYGWVTFGATDRQDATATTYYIAISKLSSTSFRVGLYDSTFTTESAGWTTTITDGAHFQDAKYLKIITAKGNNSGGGLVSGNIDDLQVWKSCSVCGASWKERGVAS